MTASGINRQSHEPSSRFSPRGASLAEALEELYLKQRDAMGEEDLAHIRNVAAYSRAIDDRARELIMRCRTPRELWRGAILRGLHILLEFSELGHNILHGSYDGLEALDPGGPFHSERWTWDFVADEQEWRTMHHENHHPHTNIVHRDHDLGYSFGRWMPGQDWYGHHVLQTAILGVLLAHAYPFALYTATSAARTEGRRVLTRRTFRNATRRIAAHFRRNYLAEPIATGLRAPITALGNYAGTVFGYDLTALVLAIEHHAEDVELYHDPGPSESADAFYERQFRTTMNFTDGGAMDTYLQRILEEEVPFPDRPDFRVFYGGLDTHIEHHLFPDLPCRRQRDVSDEVRRIAESYGIPYNERPLGELVGDLLTRFVRFSVPTGQGETTLSVLRRPARLLRRLGNGLRYRTADADHSDDAYLKRPRAYEVDVRVLTRQTLANGDATALELEMPQAWEHLRWPPGAFISLRLDIDGQSYVRPYSLLDERDGSNTLRIAIRRVPGGVVSNHIADNVNPGDTVRLVAPPEATGGLAQTTIPQKALYLAGGVGITPILSMLRRYSRCATDGDATLLYFNRNGATTLFAEELQRLAGASERLSAHFFTDEYDSNAVQDVQTRQARVSKRLLSEHLPEAEGLEVYMCGPQGFMDAARTALLELGVEPGSIHEERFDAVEPSQFETGMLHDVALLRSGVTLSVDEGQTLLAAARAAGIAVPSGCERGLCRACACSKHSGETQTGSRQHDGSGRVTLCNSYPRSPVELDL